MAKSEGVNKSSIATTSELAGIMALSPRRLQQLVADGVLEQVEEGRFLLGESIQRYITYIKGGEKTDEERRLDLEKKRAEVQMKKARARREELQTAELDGKMFRTEDIEALTNDLVYSFRGSIMALPPRVAVDVAAENNPAMCAEIIRREVKMIMRELSEHEFNHEKYMERVREREQMGLQYWEPDEDEE